MTAPSTLPILMPAGPTQRRFSAAEDAAVLAAFDELGPKWGLIAQRLPGRTEAAVKSRYFRRRAAEERSLSSALNSLLQEDDPTASGQQWSRLIGGLDGTGEAAAGAAVDGGGDSDDSMGVTGPFAKAEPPPPPPLFASPEELRAECSRRWLRKEEAAAAPPSLPLPPRSGARPPAAPPPPSDGAPLAQVHDLLLQPRAYGLALADADALASLAPVSGTLFLVDKSQHARFRNDSLAYRMRDTSSGGRVLCESHERYKIDGVPAINARYSQAEDGSLHRRIYSRLAGRGGLDRDLHLVHYLRPPQQAEPATPMELGPAHASPPDTAPLEARVRQLEAEKEAAAAAAAAAAARTAELEALN